MSNQAPTSDQPTPASSHDWIETTIEWASGIAAAAMFAYGVALSYSVLHAIAAAAKLSPWAATLWPLGFEAFMASAALNALAEQRRRRGEENWKHRVPWYPWTLVAVTAGGSILLNWFHPAIPLDPPPPWLVSVVYGLPPLIAVFAWHLFLQRIAHRRASAAAVVAAAADAVTAEAAADPAGTPPPPSPPPPTGNSRPQPTRNRNGLRDQIAAAVAGLTAAGGLPHDLSESEKARRVAAHANLGDTPLATIRYHLGKLPSPAVGSQPTAAIGPPETPANGQVPAEHEPVGVGAAT